MTGLIALNNDSIITLLTLLCRLFGCINISSSRHRIYAYTTYHQKETGKQQTIYILSFFLLDIKQSGPGLEKPNWSRFYWASSHFWDAVAPVLQSKDTHSSANVTTTDTMFVRWSTVYRYYALLCISCGSQLFRLCRLLSLKQTDSVGFWFVEQLFKFFFRGRLFLLHQISMALGNTPRIRDRHGGTLGTTRGWL